MSTKTKKRKMEWKAQKTREITQKYVMLFRCRLPKSHQHEIGKRDYIWPKFCISHQSFYNCCIPFLQFFSKPLYISRAVRYNSIWVCSLFCPKNAQLWLPKLRILLFFWSTTYWKLISAQFLKILVDFPRLSHQYLTNV